MTDEQIWNCETSVSELLGINIPDWIEQGICPSTIVSICQGGCASGAYMPAITYSTALRTMAEEGDDVLQYIEDQMGELPAPSKGESWSGMACFYLSCAVELWAGSVYGELEAFDMEDA